MKKLMMVIAGMFIISGCATKQYPQAPSVTSEESAALDCAAIKQEIAKTHSIQNEIETTGQFDGRTVLGALGDFGIGNGMAKSEARKKAQARLQQLESLKTVKCSDSKVSG
ncbi:MULTISPECIES: lipoprotein [Klebsiella]|uniref:Lipoprotein n=1 Tax=Klebsiella aerogenes (strain ATCC 13048 / DSM 30053 / CCUG 1429 / JCM 1235 / KCTC 2190 / NBRC 13534 / NCIMB 10102 / NCTC 10006 / CDC 819-56) TaxID=1028307 RepID=A0A0H3FX09_KLEAK|nr:lipoprotein [Klebsiella aerogenes]AEG99111.1 lipoprotein [Klebsiella aerogenes KCTC 2190]EIW9476304.1 lipoprotein [Klebsiella aerogenes]EIW9496507.1 lipoprotein [Klebsiella aerogenes]EKM7512185.1 lipoprotein [Klebsiella aerogenes]ELJ2009615.1 lipoprotein [Klebsiella aerogenes]